MELTYMFYICIIKAQMLVFCDQIWWRKPEILRKTTGFRWATTTYALSKREGQMKINIHVLSTSHKSYLSPIVRKPNVLYMQKQV